MSAGQLKLSTCELGTRMLKRPPRLEPRQPVGLTACQPARPSSPKEQARTHSSDKVAQNHGLIIGIHNTFYSDSKPPQLERRLSKEGPRFPILAI